MPPKVFNFDSIKIESLTDGDTFELTAPANTSITIWFPPCRDPLEIGSTTLQPGQKIVRRVFAEKGRYPFSIYMHATNKMCVPRDASGPEMIIQ
jgi:hypothetical protein